MSDAPSAEELARVEPFAGLPAPDAASARAALQVRELAAGETLFAEGEAGYSAFVLVSGAVETRRQLPGGGGDWRLQTLRAVALFGEIPLLLDHPRSVTAQAVEPSRVWEICRESLEAALSAGEPWAGRFLLALGRSLCRRLLAVESGLALAFEELAAEQVPVRRQELRAIEQRLSQWLY